MEKQTAVEWLVEQYIKHSGDLLEMGKAFEEAKSMEKDQLKETAMHFFPTSLKKEHFEHYYKETYGK